MTAYITQKLTLLGNKLEFFCLSKCVAGPQFDLVVAAPQVEHLKD